MQDMVSIVVPIYNQEIYLDRSLNSLINQSYHNIEIICVNDGSTDQSLKILQDFASKDDRIKIVSKDNGGLVSATVMGIKESRGKYICFCDPDDYVGSDFILTFISNINRADFIACGFYQDNNESITTYRLDKDYFYSGKSLKVLRDNFILDNNKIAVSNSVYVSRWNKMYRLSCVNEILNEYEKCFDVSLGEDSVFTYLILNHCKTGVTLMNPNSYYYNTRSQTSMMGNTETAKHMKKAKIAYEKFNSIEKIYGHGGTQSLALYFFLIESIFQRTKKYNNDEFTKLFSSLKKDSTYNNALNYIIKRSKGKDKLKLIMRKMIKQPRLYLKLSVFS